MPTMTWKLAVTITSIASMLAASPTAFADSAQSFKLTNEAIAQMKDGDDAGAVITLIRAIYADPANLQARRTLARAELKIGKADECIRLMETLIKVQPNVAGDQMILGQAYFAQGKTDEAMQRFKQALVFDPNNAQALLGMADVFIAKHEYSQAATCCRRILSLPNASAAAEAAHNKLSIIEQCAEPIAKPPAG